MSEGRALVYPQVLAFGARPLAVPGRGNVLCISALLPFRLTDGEVLKPAAWYEAVSRFGGPVAVPDAVTPLPGAEALLLGPIPPVAEAKREAFLRCGGIVRSFILHRDPSAPEVVWSADADAAIWHEDDNPGGRGGPDDDRPPLIVDTERPERPLWLGPTAFDHPVRLRRIGVPDEQSGTGWPREASPDALHDAHRAFWTPSLHPNDPLVLTGPWVRGHGYGAAPLPRFDRIRASARRALGFGDGSNSRCHPSSRGGHGRRHLARGD